MCSGRYWLNIPVRKSYFFQMGSMVERWLALLPHSKQVTGSHSDLFEWSLCSHKYVYFPWVIMFLPTQEIHKQTPYLQINICQVLAFILGPDEVHPDPHCHYVTFTFSLMCLTVSTGTFPQDNLITSNKKVFTKCISFLRQSKALFNRNIKQQYSHLVTWFCNSLCILSPYPHPHSLVLDTQRHYPTCKGYFKYSLVEHRATVTSDAPQVGQLFNPNNTMQTLNLTTIKCSGNCLITALLIMSPFMLFLMGKFLADLIIFITCANLHM